MDWTRLFRAGKMGGFLAVAAALVASSACTPLAYRDVTGRMRSSDEFNAESVQCQTDARNSATTVQIGAAADSGESSADRLAPQRQRAYDSCMRTRGWSP